MADKKIRGGHALIAVGTCLLGLIAYAGGCSVPDRKYVDDTAGGTSSGGGTTSGGQGGAAHGGATTTGGSSGNAGSTGAEGGEAGATTGGQPGMDRPVPTKGLIVIGGTAIAQTQGVLSVIEPVTGKELLPELLPAKTQIAEIAYDGASKKDVWYVFVAGTFPAAPDKVVELQVRYFDDKTNKWIILSKMPAQPPPVPGTVVVLNDRLAYLSNTVINQVVTPTLTIIDTSNVLKLSAVTYTPTNEAGAMVTLIGTRGTAADPLGVGGTLDLGFAEKCTGAGGTPPCELHVLPISVADTTIVNGVARLIGSYKGSVVAASSLLTQQANVVMSDPAGTLSLFYTDPDAPGGATSFSVPQALNDMSDLTIAECQNMAFFTANSENQLIGVRFNNGAAKALDLGRPGQLVAYEPFSKDVITSYNPPNDKFIGAAPDAGIPGPDITAVTVVAPVLGSSIMMTERTTGWTPPTNLRANVMATRFPVPYKCP